jgi:hypothetical protein
VPVCFDTLSRTRGTGINTHTLPAPAPVLLCSSVLATSNTQYHNACPTGFALFTTRAQALDAIQRLNGEEFDDGVRLRAEPARKNLFLKVSVCALW